MKISLNVIPECPIEQIVQVVKHAENLGYQRCWVYDEGLATRDVHIVMTAIALETNLMEIGPGITNPYTRHPAQTAAAIMTLDELSKGRAFLGIGAGGSLTLDPLEIRREKPLTAVRDTIEITRKLLTGKRVSHEGLIASIESAQIDYTRQDIEIWLAGRGPKMLALGGELADGVMLDFIYKPELGEYIENIRHSKKTKVCYSTAIVTDEQDLEFVRPHMTYRLVDAPPRVKESIGITPEEIDRIRSALGSGLESAARHVKDEWIAPFIIQGTPSECKEEIREICDKNEVDEFLIPMFDMPDPKKYLDQIASILLPT
jgi:5,10-methylenetetrahydromethanopterin reductase